MLEVLGAGGIGSGGLNFDAKVRRSSHETVDLFHAHIGGMDAFARGLLVAAAIKEDGFLEEFKANRYAPWNDSAAKTVLAHKSSLTACEEFIQANGAPKTRSGRQEYLENIINTFI